MAGEAESEEKLNDEELEAIARAAQQNAQILARVGSPADAPLSVQSLRRGDEAMVLVTVPKEFQYRPDHHRLVVVMPGTQYIPEHLVNHFWFRGNGVAPAGAVEQAVQAMTAKPMPAYAPGEPSLPAGEQVFTPKGSKAKKVNLEQI